MPCMIWCITSQVESPTVDGAEMCGCFESDSQRNCYEDFAARGRSPTRFCCTAPKRVCDNVPASSHSIDTAQLPDFHAQPAGHRGAFASCAVTRSVQGRTEVNQDLCHQTSATPVNHLRKALPSIRAVKSLLYTVHQRLGIEPASNCPPNASRLVT